MKHAFLIIAHNKFDKLQELVYKLDSGNSDVFIHIDAKVPELPVIQTGYSRVSFCDERVDVRWGDVSQILCELTLLKFAMEQGASRGEKYDYSHIISGVQMLMVSHETFDSYFSNKPTAVFQLLATSEKEKDMKVRRCNLCTRSFKSEDAKVERISQLIWRFSNAFQRIAHLRRYRNEDFIKATNWCSLSFAAADYLVSSRDHILKKYLRSFCGDEFFAPSELIASPLGKDISFRNNYLYQVFEGPSPRVLTEADRKEASEIGFIWARKW